MNLYTYDGTTEGMLTAVATAIKSRQPVEDIVSSEHFQGGLFTQNYPVVTNNDQAGRLMHYLQTSLGRWSLHYIMYAMLSEMEGCELAICDYIRHSLKKGKQLDCDEAHPAVRKVHDIHHKVSHEVCRMKGFIRFLQLKDDILYAPFEPDHNIIIPVANHFQDRLPANQWIIHDIKRNIALRHHKAALELIDIDPEFTRQVAESGSVDEEHLESNEKLYQDLWQTFFKTVSIEERTNPKLQRGLMPQRYWKYLVEV